MRKLLLLLLTVFTLCISHENASGKTISAGGYYSLPQSRYVFVPEQLTWNEHNDRAKAMGGQLVSITSAEENQQVTSISRGEPVWIGGIRKGRGNGSGADHWYWSDGQPWTYTNWYPGEPNSSGGHENRVHLGLQAPGTWNDALSRLQVRDLAGSAAKILEALKVVLWSLGASMETPDHSPNLYPDDNSATVRA